MSMIARRWTGWAGSTENADAYFAHFEGSVRPSLESTEGFLDANLDRVSAANGSVRIVVETRWTSMDAVRAFAGDEVDVAVVEPEASAVLDDFDERVQHVELPDDGA